MATALPRAKELLQSSLLADVTVKCEEFEWKVHKAILASGSKFFEKAFSGNFKEAADKSITLHDEKPEMVARMLLCLYTSSYPDLFYKFNDQGPTTVRAFLGKGYPAFKAKQFEHEKNPFMVHSEMYAMAEKYDMPGLQAVCVTKFAFGRDSQYPQYPKYIEPATLPNFLKALDHVYTSTPPSSTALRQKAAALVQTAYSDIVTEEELKTQLASACKQNGQLGWDVLSNLFNRRELQCPHPYCPNWPCKPFDDVRRFKGGKRSVCICGLTQLCGSLACSKVVEETWPCDDCDGGSVGRKKVVECELEAHKDWEELTE